MSDTSGQKNADELVGMYELLDTVQVLVHASEPALKTALNSVFDAYSRHFPDEYFWAIGPQAPALLHNLMFALMPPEMSERAKSARPRTH